MPKPRKPASNNLARLPRLPNLVLQGSKRTLSIPVVDEAGLAKPVIALWVDSEAAIRSLNVTTAERTTDNGLSEALESLLTAMSGPFMAEDVEPGLPEKVQVDDEELAAKAREVLEPLNIPVEVLSELPKFDQAFDLLAQAIIPELTAEPPEPFEWDIKPALIAPLYRAADTFARLAPWQYTPDNPPLAIRLGENGPTPETKIIYASVLGGSGILQGIAFYNSLASYYEVIESSFEREEMAESAIEDLDIETEMTKMRQMGLPVDELKPDELAEVLMQLRLDEQGAGGIRGINDSMTLWLEPSERLDPTYLDWLKKHGLKYNKRQLIPDFNRVVSIDNFQRPDERETQTLLASLEGLNQFFQKTSSQFRTGMYPAQGLNISTKSSIGTMVTVEFPPPAYDHEHFEKLALEEAAKNKGKKFNIYQLIFNHNTGELLEKVAEDYQERLLELFHKSPEWQAWVEERDEVNDWTGMLLELGINYLGVTPAQMAPAQFRELLLEIVPRKITVQPEEASNIVRELRTFWQYLEREFELPNAAGCLRLLSDYTTELLEEELDDESNYGPAKAMLMQAVSNGLDLSSEESLEAWVNQMNSQAFGSSQLPPGLLGGAPALASVTLKPKPAGNSGNKGSRGKPPGSSKNKKKKR